MNLKILLDNAAETIHPNFKKEMAAAIYLGARLALEAVIADEGPYHSPSDAKTLLASISGGMIVMDQPMLEEPPPAPEVPIPEESSL